MAKLVEVVADPAKRQEVVAQALKVLDQEVADKGGLTGMAIKGAYAMAKGIAPGIMPRIVNGLLDDFLAALEPFYEQAKQKGVDVAQHLTGQASVVANALLAITDARAARHEGGPLKKGYEKLRPTAQKHVEQAVPRLAQLVKQYAP
jgi:hypothetical protein